MPVLKTFEVTLRFLQKKSWMGGCNSLRVPESSELKVGATEAPRTNLAGISAAMNTMTDRSFFASVFAIPVFASPGSGTFRSSFHNVGCGTKSGNATLVQFLEHRERVTLIESTFESAKPVTAATTPSRLSALPLSRQTILTNVARRGTTQIRVLPGRRKEAICSRDVGSKFGAVPVIASSAANQYDHAICAHEEIMCTTGMTHPEDVETREPVLDTVDRISELCFGPFMALTFVGAVSAATAGEDAGRNGPDPAAGVSASRGAMPCDFFLIDVFSRPTLYSAYGHAQWTNGAISLVQRT